MCSPDAGVAGGFLIIGSLGDGRIGRPPGEIGIGSLSVAKGGLNSLNIRAGRALDGEAIGCLSRDVVGPRRLCAQLQVGVVESSNHVPGLDLVADLDLDVFERASGLK